MAKSPVPDSSVFEKLGAFYLGRGYDLDAGATTDDLLLYDSKDLTTHAVCVGMTGSGKTGLCVGLLEEAAMDGIPAIAIDPKGDLGNLLLTFPKLRPEDFRPWIEEGEAARKGMSPEEYAGATAKKWKEGLAAWGQNGKRIARLRETADFAIYTPGSSAGRQVTVLKRFTAPTEAVRDDADAFRERIASAVSGLLALVGVDADPVQSREHILLSTLFQHAWQEGRDLDVASLIAEVQQPPVTQIGVMDVETFFPSEDRFALSMRLNGLLASPGFAAWLEGEPLDVPRLLWTPEGKPRIAVVSIAHLSEPERMFFVTLLLNEVISWMRAQPGTGSLRALLYMDEVFGYFPPTANPPSKMPMLTLLKQARAYGVGVVLATQNPVDLDYKGLSNAGTWFLGRLQTERDKLRVLGGLEGASAAAGAAFDRARLDKVLAGLDARVFLMNNVHDDQPVLFHTRWAMSYLRGPLTRDQIKTLMGDRPLVPVAPAGAAAQPTKRDVKAASGKTTRPAVPPDANEAFLDANAMAPAGARLVYRPALLGVADLHYADARSGIDQWDTGVFLAPLHAKSGPAAWSEADRLAELPELANGPRPQAEFAPLPSRAAQPKSYDAWSKSFKSYLYKEAGLELFKCRELKLVSEPSEDLAAFTVRLREAAREKRDLALEKLRKQYAPRLRTIQERVRRAEERIGVEQSQVRGQQMQTALSVGATVLGALFGRKAASVGTVGRATTAARSAGRIAKQKDDVARARRELEAQQQRLVDLEAEFQQETAALQETGDVDAYAVTTQMIRPRKTDITVQRSGLVWVPWWIDTTGAATPAFTV